MTDLQAERIAIGQLLTRIEAAPMNDIAMASPVDGWIVGVTGPPGAGKSTLVNALVRHLRYLGQTVAVLAVDPSSPQSGGALLGDRIRMSEHVGDHGVFVRSLASRGHLGGLALAIPLAARALLGHGFDWVILETVGVGQSEIDVAIQADTTVVVQVPGLGDDLQAGKAGILEVADVMVVNKADQPGARELQKQLVSALHLGRRTDRQVPVILIQATAADSGVEALHTAITTHRRDAEVSGELSRHRGERKVLEWRDRCRILIQDELERAIASAAGKHLAEAIHDGAISPAEAASSLLEQVLARPRAT